MTRTSDPSWPVAGPGGWPSSSGQQTPPPEPPRWYMRRRLWATVAILTTIGYLLIGTLATVRVYREFHRRPTAWELYRAAGEEVGNRWRTWPPERIFPASVPYTSEQGGIEHARRVGIATGSGCEAGLDAGPAAVLKRYGCRALLRATYIDQMQGVVMTVGVAALADDRAAAVAKAALQPGEPTRVGPYLHALAFPRTAASRFDNAARQYISAGQSGPYVVLTVAGQSDGRPAAAVRVKHTGAFLLAPEVGGNIAEALALPAQPDCAERRRWKC